MRHVLVTRFVIALVAVYLVSAWQFARLARPTGAPAAAASPGPAAPTAQGSAAAGQAALAGPRLFEERCGTCHSAGALADQANASNDSTVRLREFGAFLADHGDATVEEDAAILAYLSALVGSRKPSPR
ncbi:MAG: hypothetical protein ABMA15_17325 [Vicinamibacterales bacterium]